MSNVFDTQRLIDTVKRIANIPDNQSQISDEQILNFANEEISTSLLAVILAKKETYYTINHDVEISDKSVKKYALPTRAIGSKIEWIGYYYNDNPEDDYELNMITYDQRGERISGISNTTYANRRFYFENESIVIDTRDSDIDFDVLRFRFNIQPNTLVASTRVAVITGIDTTTGLITVSDTIPDNFTTTSKIDFIRSDSPNNILDYDIDLVSLNSSAKFFEVDPLDIPDQLQVGDRICLAQETDLIYAPTEMHPILAQMVAVRVLESNGDDARTAQNTLNKKIDDTQFLMTSRDSSSPVKASAWRNRGRRNRNRNNF